MDIDQIKIMIKAGMYVGSHSYEHLWLPGLSLDMQEKEIDASVDFLKNLGLSTDSWTMNYPFGGYDESIITLLKIKGFKAGLATRPGVAQLTDENAFTLESLDTNDFVV
jgi:peptidoglycan/xylan/chitin deacetylase (PgdA/CDA1 family)